MKNKIKLIIFSLFLNLLFLSFFSCLSENEVKNKIDEKKNSENVTLNVENNDQAKQEEEEENFVEKTSNTDENSLHDNSELRDNLLAGKYEKIINMTENKDDYPNKYYRGIAFMSMMLQKKRFDSEERINFRNNAEELLKDVGYNSNDEYLKARGLLWYAVTVDLAYSELIHKKKAIAAFYKIEKDLKDTPYYNDALFYVAQTYSRMGWYGVARNYFIRSASNVNVDTQVYDYVDNKFYPIDVLADIGLQRLQSYVHGYNSAYSEE